MCGRNVPRDHKVANGAEGKKKPSSAKAPLEVSGGVWTHPSVRPSVLPRGSPFLASSLTEYARDLFVRGRETKGSPISTAFYLCPAAPASPPPVLSHVSSPQEAALLEG